MHPAKLPVNLTVNLFPPIQRFCFTTNKHNRQGGTPLHRAAATGQTEVVKTLLGMGANGKHLDKLNMGILYFADQITGRSMYNWFKTYEFPDGSKLESKKPIPAADGASRIKKQNPSKLYWH